MTPCPGPGLGDLRLDHVSTAVRVRWSVESEAGVPIAAGWCAHNRLASAGFAAPRTIPIAVPTGVIPRSRRPAVVLDGMACGNAAVSPVRSAQARSSAASA